jgi:hypothetical protein
MCDVKHDDMWNSFVKHQNFIVCWLKVTLPVTMQQCACVCPHNPAAYVHQDKEGGNTFKQNDYKLLSFMYRDFSVVLVVVFTSCWSPPWIVVAGNVPLLSRPCDCARTTVTYWSSVPTHLLLVDCGLPHSVISIQWLLV